MRDLFTVVHARRIHYAILLLTWSGIVELVINKNAFSMLHSFLKASDNRYDQHIIRIYLYKSQTKVNSIIYTMTRSDDVFGRLHSFLKASDSRYDQHILYCYESYTNIHSVKKFNSRSH